MHAARALIGLATAGITALSLTTVSAAPALATVTLPDPAPVRVVVASPLVALSVPVSTSGLAQGQHVASLWVAYSGDLLPELAGSGTSTASAVAVTANLDTTRLPAWGPMVASVMDDADGSTTPVTLDVRRKTIVMLNHVEARPGRRVALGARVTHYSPAAGTYIASNLSPVVYQEYVDGNWVTRARSISTSDGLAGVILRATPGTHTYRVVRPTGLTVWSAVSSAQNIVVQP